MAISKIILNGVTQMDVTDKTVTAASMRNGVTALKNDGTDITGSLADMTLPSAASASSSGTSKATITPTSSAQYLNIPEGYNDAAQFYTIAAASGGSSNIVTGTFKGTTTGAAMDINIPYTGNGYPVVAIIYPSEGPYNASAGTFYSLVQRYATQALLFVKDKMTTPSYSDSGADDCATVVNRYKNSTSNATTYGQAGSSGNNSYQQGDAQAGSSTRILRFKSKTKMSVFIASTVYGFAANIDYRYYIIYSS